MKPRGRRCLLAPSALRRWNLTLLCGLFVLLLHPRRAESATLVYSTYFGGASNDMALAVAVDAAGNAYVAGQTDSTNGLPLLNAFQPNYAGGFMDAFLAKFDPAGRLLFSTYFGGSGWDVANSIAFDPKGNIVVVGATTSVDLPTTDDAFQPDYGGGSAFGSGDGFIAKFTPDGSRLLYCSYFGGSLDDRIDGVAIDASGNVCINGQTSSTDLPLKNALQPKLGGGDNDGFVAKFDATLTNLIFSTYFGGNDQDELQKIAVDPAGYIYVCGLTLSTNFPVTPGAFQTSHPVATNSGPNWAAIISKFKPDGSALAYSTYVDGPQGDSAYAIAADAAGSAYVTGSISLPWPGGDFPRGFQPTPGFGAGAGWTAWVAKLRPDGSNFEWFSYLGGSGGDQGFGLVLDKNDNVFVTGITESLDFPTRDAPQPKFGGGIQDAFAAMISADGQQLLYSTYLGGRADEWGFAVALDPNENLLLVGQTSSLNFPVRDAFQPTNASAQNMAYAQNDPEDAFIIKLSQAVQPPLLEIARSGGSVLLFWSTNAADFALETADASAAPLAWAAVSAQPLTISGQHTVIQPVAGSSRLYRLHRP